MTNLLRARVTVNVCWACDHSETNLRHLLLAVRLARFRQDAV